MVHSEICPVCKGTGKIPVVNGLDSTTVSQEKTCHGCGGRGWVEVGRDDNTFHPYPYYPQYPWIITW